MKSDLKTGIHNLHWNINRISVTVHLSDMVNLHGNNNSSINQWAPHITGSLPSGQEVKHGRHEGRFCTWVSIIYTYQIIKDSCRKFKRNEYLISVWKSVKDPSWSTSTFRSTFSAKTAYIFKIVDRSEQLDVWIW